ncbi:MAG: SpoIIE family protein phosphatase [Mariprofundaceae bacterium]|nr:SpoIIE family protein phosphatase [Mariprofundaceae bacterium]
MPLNKEGSSSLQQRALHQDISIWQYLASLWVMPVMFALIQLVIRFTENPLLNGATLWFSLLNMSIFLVGLVAAAWWVHYPIRVAMKQGKPEKLEHAIRLMPWRSVQSFGLMAVLYVLYFLLVIGLSFVVADVTMTLRMIVALTLSIVFSLGILTPMLAITLTLSWLSKARKRLTLHQLFINDLEQNHTYHWFIRASNRPWLIFAVTSLLPVSILALFSALMLGSQDQAEQHFVLMQAVVLFSALIVGGTTLIWVTSRMLRRITLELSSGLNFLRQGKFDGRVAIMMDDEMGDLASGLNTALQGLKERDNLKDSLAIASDIQRGLMPKGEPNIEHYAITGFQQSCFEVGGDYYDYIERNNGTVWLVIADVAGKGYPAALTVANLQAMLHALANAHDITLLDAVTYINQSLYQSLQGGRFVTFFIAELHPEKHSLTWLNAGHTPPLLWHQDGMQYLEATSPPLGMLEQINLSTMDLSLAIDDALFACTDGVTEARRAAGSEMFGEKRLHTWFGERNQLDPSVWASSLLARLDETGFVGRDDDVTMLCLKRES